MTIVCLSLSHRSAPAGVLEKLAVPPRELGEVLARLHAVPGIDEVVVLSTCNRVEVYAAVPGPAGRATGPVVPAVAGLLGARGRIPAGEVLAMARIRVGGAAAEHLFSVACGLDSMAVGEDQIVAQVKAAARTAAAARTTGPAVTGLIDAALRASKRARTQTTISTEGISLARAGLDIAAAHLGGLADRHAVVLGTGSTGKLVARLLREAGVGRLSVASRSQVRAAEVATAVGGRPLQAADVPAALAGADLLVTATGAAAPLVAAGPVRAARAQTGGRPLFVLDLGMPPDVEPAVGRLAGVTLADLTALARHLAGRAVPDQIPRARAIVAAEAAAYIGPAGPSGRRAGHRRDARPDQAARRRRTRPAAPPAPGPQRSTAGRDGGHRPPHPPQDLAPADRPGQRVLHRPERAALPRRPETTFRPQNG